MLFSIYKEKYHMMIKVFLKYYQKSQLFNFLNVHDMFQIHQ